MWFLLILFLTQPNWTSSCKYNPIHSWWFEGWKEFIAYFSLCEVMISLTISRTSFLSLQTIRSSSHWSYDLLSGKWVSNRRRAFAAFPLKWYWTLHLLWSCFFMLLQNSLKLSLLVFLDLCYRKRVPQHSCSNLSSIWIYSKVCGQCILVFVDVILPQDSLITILYFYGTARFMSIYYCPIRVLHLLLWSTILGLICWR